MIYTLPPDEHQQAVEECERVGRGGVDGRTDGDALLHQGLHHCHGFVGGVGVEAGRGLIEEQHTWVHHHRQRHVGALGLPPRDPPAAEMLLKTLSDIRIGHLCEGILLRLLFGSEPVRFQ